MPPWTILAAACLACGPALAQAPPAPTEVALADAIRLGALATLAPLCNLRDEAWSFDLRRATVMDTTGAPHPDDDTLGAAPNHDLAIAALSHAEAEALETFAEAPPATTCLPLTDDPDLPRADHIVQSFRALKPAS